MGLEKTRGQNYHLSALLEGIEAGTVVLPEFQRDFDWNTSQIRQLVATVLLGWPLGSLLLLPGAGDTFFSLRSFQDAPPMMNPELVVLDGQQRLTALFHALHGKGKGRFALRIDLMSQDQTVEDLEESIEWFPDSQWTSRFPTPTSQLAAYLLPITALRSPSDFYEWRDDAIGDGNAGVTKDLTVMYKTTLAGLHQYEVPAAVINPDVPGAAVARIFERVNRLGKPLGTFDLVVAKSFTKDFNLRDRWSEAQRDFPRLQAFLGDDGLPVLNVVALRAMENVRAQAVLDLTGESVRDNWDQATVATNEAVNFCSTYLGVLAPDWLPYKPVLTILAGLSLEYPLVEHVEGLRRWFWSTVFSGNFDVASNTRAVAAYKILRDDPERFTQVSLVRDDLLESNKKQFGAIHRAFTSFLASRNPVDVESGEPLIDVDESGLVPDLGVLSVFPRAAGSDESLHLRSLSNILVRGRDERKYAFVDISHLDSQLLRQQLIDPAELDSGSPEEFFEMRLANLVDALRSDVGLGVVVAERR